MTNGQRANVCFALNNTVISTGQTAGDPLVRATVGSAFTLDGVGNRTQTDLNAPLMPSYNSGTVNYTYYTGNIQHTADGNTYTHDANGNRIKITNRNNIAVANYTYDSLNRLTQVTTSGRTIRYIYNGLSQRVAKIDNGVRTNYLIDPNGILPQVLAEMDASNKLKAFYVYDGTGLVALAMSSSYQYFYHYDGLGNTIAITDKDGKIVNSYAYSPEGLVKRRQESMTNPFQYVGRYGVMTEYGGPYSNLYYMRARYYDPEVGRFINKDPIGYAGGLNLFAYVGNNPVSLVDPLGLDRVRRGPIYDIFDRYKFDFSKVDWWNVVGGVLLVDVGEFVVIVGGVVIVITVEEFPLESLYAGGMIMGAGGGIVYLGASQIVKEIKKGVVDKNKEKACH